jgi:hypothetical protein
MGGGVRFEPGVGVEVSPPLIDCRDRCVSIWPKPKPKQGWDDQTGGSWPAASRHLVCCRALSEIPHGPHGLPSLNIGIGIAA